jgi:hypothetical protein
MTMFRRLGATASALLIGSLGAISPTTMSVASAADGGTPAAARAASAPRKNTDKVNITAWKYLDGLQTCAKVTITGTVKYTAQHWSGIPGGGFTDEWRITKTRLVAPKTTVRLYAYDPGDHACTTRAVKKDLKFTVGFSGYSCKWNPSLSVLLPFSVGINFWPDCANHKVVKGHVSKHHVDHASLYDQDVRAKFGNQKEFTYGGKPPFHCIGALVKVQAGNASGDDVRVSTGRKKICLTPKY